ncbi:MAG: dTMP kinase [Ignavibacteria bacterium]|nr:dTMP kinase [Ignavibacteria bacterium]
MFITFEGLDFCGKSTQVKLLENYLIENDIQLKLIREPGGTSISEKVRDILLDKKNSEMTIETELILFAASRSQLVNQVILPALNEGIFVISDRFHDSSIAYQSFGRGIDLDFVVYLQNFVIGQAVPDITFYLDITVEEMLSRKRSFKQIDRIESSENDFYEKVREGYLYLSDKHNRFRKIDGTLPFEEIHSIVLNEIKFVKKGQHE